MRKHPTILIAAISISFAGLSGGSAAEQDLPVVKGKKIVASVDGEPITQDEFNRELTSMKRDAAPEEKDVKKAELELLKRLINIRLIVQEAKRIGLQKLPEVSQMIDSFSKETLREELAVKITRDVRVNGKEVERNYNDSIREWKINAILCEKEEYAKSMEAELKAGGDFNELAKTFVAEGKAKRGEEGVYLRAKDVDPVFGEVLSRMAKGSTSSIIQMKSGYVILRLEDTRYNDDPREKDKAWQNTLMNARQEALTAYDEGLKRKYVKINREVLNTLDYDSVNPGLEALLKDTRVVAEIKGDKPVTVGELTEQLKFQFYHGVERAAERRKLTARKETVLEGLLHRRVFRREALRLGLDKTESYASKVREYENSMLFAAFVNKAIAPTVTVTEEELKTYYERHMKDYTTPEMIKVQGLVFAKRGDAESAIGKLKEGTEFQWVTAHAEGQVDKNAQGVLSFDGRLLITDDLPEVVRKAIAGSRPGDFRLYTSSEGHFYVLAIQDVVPARTQPYDQAKQAVAKKLFDDKAKKAVEEYADKLRSLSNVKVYFNG